MRQSELESNTSKAIEGAVKKTLCESDFAFFIRYVFKHHYNIAWLNNWHHDEIIKLIYKIEARKVPNAVINIPPRYGKTEIVVVLWMAWTFIRNRKAKFIHASYSVDLALSNSDKVRQILKSPCIQEFWKITMQDSADSKSLWLTKEGGGLLARSSDGQVTGFGAGITGWKMGEDFDGAIIIDDPLKVADLNSETTRERVNRNISETFHSRKNHPLVPIVIVMQRLHEDDSSAFALNGGVMGEEFAHLKIKAMQDDGSALWVAKHDAEKLKVMQQADRFTFAGQYQQEPYSQDGNIFNLTFCNRYEMVDEFKNYQQIVLSLDTAYKSNEHNDPSCITVWGLTKTYDDLIECVNKRMEYPELKKTLIEFAARYKPKTILIEDKSSGQALIQELQRDTNLPVIAIKPHGDKLSRASAATSYIVAGRIRLPQQAHWLAEFEKQLVHFPNAKHDDIVDSVSQFINWRTAHAIDAQEIINAWGRMYQ